MPATSRGTYTRAACAAAALLLAWVFIGSVAAFADDAAVTAEGGVVKLMRPGHRSVTMVSEYVFIDRLPAGRVTATFVFKNHGPTSSVEIGFPGEAQVGSPELTGFRSWVDGKEVAVRRTPNYDESSGDGPSITRCWYVKNVRFDHGQTRVIKDEYFGGGGTIDDVGKGRFYAYDIGTGGSWYGAIGKGTIVVDVSGLAPYGFPDFEPKGDFVRHGSKAVWSFSNYKPDDGDGFQFTWYANYEDVTINGHPVTRPNGDYEYPPWMFAVRRGNELWAPAMLATYWLGGHLYPIGNGASRIQLGKAWVKYQTGSKQLTTSTGRPVTLPFPVDVEKQPLYGDPDYCQGCTGYQMIGLIGLIRALGGTAHFDKDNISLIATFPNHTPRPASASAGK